MINTAMLTLYLKEHNETGKRYLGYTSQDPFVYPGSGKHWSRHLRKHGDDVTTVILFETEKMETIRQMGLYYSELFDVVESDLFLNLTVEYGTGGPIWQGRKHSQESKKKMSRLAKQRGNNRGSGWNHSDETKEKIRSYFKDVPRSEESKRRMRKPRLKASCLRCQRVLGINNLTRHVRVCKRG